MEANLAVVIFRVVIFGVVIYCLVTFVAKIKVCIYNRYSYFCKVTFGVVIFKQCFFFFVFSNRIIETHLLVSFFKI